MTVEMNPKDRALAIDIGDTYLFAMISNAPLSRAVLVKNPLDRAAIDRARRSMQSEPEKFHTEMGRIASCVDATCDLVLRKCLEWQVGSIAIGTRSIKNPFSIRPRALRDNPLLNLSLHLLSTLRFRCALARIDVHLVDETNTSRIDALGLEPVAGAGSRRKDRATGRLTRKEYHSTTGAAIHRDINAAINIGRLVFGDSFAEPILRGRQWEHPEVEFIEIEGPGPEIRSRAVSPSLTAEELDSLVAELAGIALDEARDAFLRQKLEESLAGLIHSGLDFGQLDKESELQAETVRGLNTKRLRRYLKRRRDLEENARKLGLVVSRRAKKVLVEWEPGEEEVLQAEGEALALEAEKGGARSLLSAALSLQSRSEARAARRETLEKILTDQVQAGTTYRLDSPPARVRFIRTRRDTYAFPDILEVLPPSARPYLVETPARKTVPVSG